MKVAIVRYAGIKASLDIRRAPYLIHDSILFKNVEDDAVKGIFDLYADSSKQLFVSIDKLPSYQQGGMLWRHIKS